VEECNLSTNKYSQIKDFGTPLTTNLVVDLIIHLKKWLQFHSEKNSSEYNKFLSPLEGKDKYNNNNNKNNNINN